MNRHQEEEEQEVFEQRVARCLGQLERIVGDRPVVIEAPHLREPPFLEVPRAVFVRRNNGSSEIEVFLHNVSNDFAVPILRGLRGHSSVTSLKISDKFPYFDSFPQATAREVKILLETSPRLKCLTFLRLHFEGTENAFQLIAEGLARRPTPTRLSVKLSYFNDAATETFYNLLSEPSSIATLCIGEEVIFPGRHRSIQAIVENVLKKSGVTKLALNEYFVTKKIVKSVVKALRQDNSSTVKHVAFPANNGTYRANKRMNATRLEPLLTGLPTLQDLRSIHLNLRALRGLLPLKNRILEAFRRNGSLIEFHIEGDLLNEDEKTLLRQYAARNARIQRLRTQPATVPTQEWCDILVEAHQCDNWLDVTYDVLRADPDSFVLRARNSSSRKRKRDE
jgi:hypothetical protein